MSAKAAGTAAPVPARAALSAGTAALGIEAEQVNVKATTEEGLSFTGDGSDMAAHAVALVERKARQK